MLYESPVGKRYGSRQMSKIFSDDNRYLIWRKIWIALAQAQQDTGIDIRNRQIREMILHVNKCDLNRVRQIEKETNHDVMAHIHHYGEQCPSAKPIIHLGATSCDITDNADIILMSLAIDRVRSLLIELLHTLKRMAMDYKNIPTIGYTHMQKAQLTTVGRRICTWINDIMMDIMILDDTKNMMKLRGMKGAVGTQSGFMELYDVDKRDKSKCIEWLEQRFRHRIASLTTVDLDVYPIVTQTYPRKLDTMIVHILSSISQSASKFANDIRLLQHNGEMCEGFDNKQVGSSAMPYKRNPLNCERICSLARIIQSNYTVVSQNASNQWLERTLDDSANRRVVIPESFILIDEILTTYIDILNNMVINTNTISNNVAKHIFDVATENIMMIAVRNGGDRQDIHDRIKQYTLLYDGVALMDKIIEDQSININREEVEHILDIDNLIGNAIGQVDEFVDVVKWVM